MEEFMKIYDNPKVTNFTSDSYDPNIGMKVLIDKWKS